MDALVDDEEVVTATSEASTDKGRKTVLSPVSSVSPLRTANGTVVFTSNTAAIKHGTVQQAIAVPQPGGQLSIVQFQIPNQSNVVQSVIQPNQQSVIQAAGGATSVQTVQLPKNVIFLKGNQGSVIQSTDNTDPNIQNVQLIRTEEGETVITTAEDESKKRRDVLTRRPSYRKILNDLSSAETVSGVQISNNIKQEESEHLERAETGPATITVTSPYLKVLPAVVAGSQDGLQGSLQTLTMTNATGAGTSAIVQYATQGQDGQFFVPVTVSTADLQTYQIRTGTGNATGIAQGVVMAPASIAPQQHQIAEDAAKKRELRLLKNREAAKECRRKKKEYIKCLENRVAVLENQNKALIEELKSLKELYCQKND